MRAQFTNTSALMERLREKLWSAVVMQEVWHAKRKISSSVNFESPPRLGFVLAAVNYFLRTVEIVPSKVSLP
jgi:hypothetical protein